jgi:hypothetical protein
VLKYADLKDIKDAHCLTKSGIEFHRIADEIKNDLLKYSVLAFVM